MYDLDYSVPRNPSDTVNETLELLPPLEKPKGATLVKVFKFQDGRVFEGVLASGKREGWGRQIWSNGCFYEGYWSNDMQNGFGRFIYSDGDCYEGEWSSDKAHGTGNYYSVNGSRYSGQWINDLK